MVRKDNRDDVMKSREQVTRISILAIFLFVMCFVILFGMGMLQERGYGDDFWFPLAGISGSVLSALASVALLYSVLGDSLTYDIESKEKKYDAMELTVLDDVSQEKVKDRFTSLRFMETEDGHQRRDKFTFTKDAITYLARCVPAEELEVTIEKAFGLADQVKKRKKSMCFFLFLYKDHVDEADLEKIREYAKLLIIDETAVPHQNYCTGIIILVDRRTNEGRYLDMNSRTSISVYAHGCRLLREMFS